MCVPSIKSGYRIVVDMSTTTEEIQDCSCTFTTTANTVKVTAASTPNYPNCGSAVNVKAESGITATFECLTSSETLVAYYKNGSITLEQTAPVFDKNYCIVLEQTGSKFDAKTYQNITFVSLHLAVLDKFHQYHFIQISEKELL